LRELVRSEHLSWEQRRWRDWIRESGEFHIRLAELNQNSIITGYLRTLIARTSLLISLYQSPNTSGCSVDVHAAILDAIERGDAELSASLMQQHLGEYASGMLVEPLHPRDIDFSALFSPV
jgi:DNA-binding GntR family transcriptional regulator